MSQITLLDLANRSGSDVSVGLVEEVTTFAPELAQFPARAIDGTTYRATRRTKLPQGGFRNVGEGQVPGASTYEQFLSQCFFLDWQLQLDEAKKTADDSPLGELLADESSGALQQAAIDIGSQIYYGTTADAKGFSGLSAAVGSDYLVDAGGDGADCTSAWLVWFNPKGVRLTMGGGIVLGLTHEGEWPLQQIIDPGDSSKTMMAYVNNLKGWMGLEVNSSFAVARMHSIENSASKQLTDALGAELKSKMPQSIQNSGELRWLMNYSQAGLSLQNSRSAIGSVPASGAGAPGYAPQPESLANIPIIYTDSIVNTEAAL